MTPGQNAFQQQRRAAFEQLQVGQRYTYRRTFTEGDVAAFCGVTGDFNPVHQDEAFARDSPFGRRIVPGLLPGSMLTHIGGLLGFIAAEMHFDFLAPVYIGETVTCVVEVMTKDEGRRRVHCEARLLNEAGQKVIQVRFSGFPTQVRLHPDQACSSD